MEVQNITVMAIQKTRLSARSKLPNTPGYVMIRQDRERDSRGGLAFIISLSIQFRQIKLPRPDITDSLLEQLGITVKSGQQEIKLINCYFPPMSSCNRRYALSRCESDDALLLGDFNAHSSCGTLLALKTREDAPSQTKLTVLHLLFSMVA